jgi:voltage-gated sodium channel
MSTPRVRAVVSDWIESPRVQRAIIALVILNAVTLGLETVPQAVALVGPALFALDRALLCVFVVELSLKIYAQRTAFFRSGWNVFDLAVIGIACVPHAGPFAVFRALRVLRILRVVSAIPRMRLLVESLARSLPGLGSIGLLLAIFYYVFGVVGTKLFGAAYPDWFGSLSQSLFSLFMIMTLEGWGDIALAVMEAHPAAWLYFVSFILISTFTVLNLLVAVIVKSMEEPSAAPQRDASGDIAALRAEVAALRRALQRRAGAQRRHHAHRRSRAAFRHVTTRSEESQLWNN